MAKWTQEEIDWLRDNRTSEGRATLCEKSGRSFASVATKAKKLGFTINRNIDLETVSFIKENYLKLGAQECAKRLNINVKQLYHKANLCGVRNDRNKGWTHEQEEYLRENIYKISILDISKYLQRTISSVKNKANKLNILIDKSWDESEDLVLKNEYNIISTEDLTKKLKRTSAAIVGRAFYLGLTKPSHEWTTKDETWLKENFAIRTDRHCATFLNITESCVCNRAFKLGLKKEKIKYLSDDVRLCRLCKQDKNIDEFQYKKERDSYSYCCKSCLNTKTIERVIRFSEQDASLIKQLYNEGFGAPEIAKLTKICGRSKISQFLKQEGLSRTAKEVRDIKNSKLLGEKFGQLTLIEQLRIGDIPHWRCLCDCGNEKVIKQDYLGYTKSCGCLVTTTGSSHFAWEGYEGVSGALYGRFRAGAKTRNIEFNISKKDMWDQFVKQQQKCALTGILLTMGDDVNCTASLDRRDSSIGYIVDNIQWVHKWMNVFKSDLKEADLFAIIKACYEYNNLSNFSMPTITTVLNRGKRTSL